MTPSYRSANTQELVARGHRLHSEPDVRDEHAANTSALVETYDSTRGVCHERARSSANRSALIEVYDSMSSRSGLLSAESSRSVAGRTPPRPRLVQRLFDVLQQRRIRLSDDQRARLFQLFADVHRQLPSLLPGVSRVPGTDEHFLLAEIACPLLRRYDGRELAVFDARSAVYYRMPGAGVGASGSVAPGRHALRIDHWNLEGSLYLQIDKTPGGALRVAALATAAERGVSYQRVEGQFLDHAKLCFELEERVYRCLLWHLLSAEHLPSAGASLGTAPLRGWLDGCTALGPRLAGIAAECHRHLSAATAPGDGTPARRPS